MCRICLRLARKNYVKLSCAHFLLFWLLSTLSVYNSHCYSMSFLQLYLSFHLNSLHFNPYSPHFHADSPAPAFPSHSCIPNISLLLLHNSWHRIVVYIIYGVISVITKTYLPYSTSSKISIVCEVWAIILSGWSVTYVLCNREAQPVRSHLFF